MPPLLRVLVLALAAQTVLDAAGIGLGWADAPWTTRLVEVAALLLDLAMLAALTIGVEWVRRLLRLGAAIGVAIDTVLVTLLVGHGADSGAIATGVALLGGSLFTLWALGHRSVQAWVFDRWLLRHRL